VLRDLGITLIAADSLSSVLDDGPTSKLIRQTLGAVSEFDKAMTVAKLKGARDGVRRTNEMRRAKELRRALLSSIVIAGPPASVVLTLWLSMIAAEGLASRPVRSRSAITSAWFKVRCGERPHLLPVAFWKTTRGGS
jgi:hypothetical protein